VKPKTRNLEGVNLRGFQRFTHFQPVYFLGFLAAMALVLSLTNPQGRSLWLLYPTCIPLALLAYWRQRRALRFRVFETSQGEEANFEAVLALARRQGWVVRASHPTRFLQASVGGFPSTMRSWGEMVTVRFMGSRVYANSICDPDRQSSMTSFGRNFEHLEAVRSAVNGSLHLPETDPAAQRPPT